MITNIVKRIDEETLGIPVIVRTNKESWIPTFELWTTKINGNTSYIDCTQNFSTKLKKYEARNLDSQIGCVNNDILIIYWKTLIDTVSINEINNVYTGKLRVTNWQRRYCTYFTTNSKMPWLHSVILGVNEPEYVIHHINAVSADNRLKNLHILPKWEHDSINHPQLYERKKIFANPEKYWYEDKEMQISKFVSELSLIITDEGKNNFIANFATENMALTKEILEKAKIYFNLNAVKTKISKNRHLNFHLDINYLDSYELKKYLKVYGSYKTEQKQLKLF